MTDTASGRIFEPGTVVNLESQFYGPRQTGITYFIDRLIFTAERAYLPLRTPLELAVFG